MTSLHASPKQAAQQAEEVEVKLKTLIDGSNLSLAESVDENGRATILVLRNGIVVDSVELADTSTEQALDSKRDEDAFKKIRKDLLLATYESLQALTPETIVASSDLNTTVTAAIDSNDPQTHELKKGFLKRVKSYVWDPMVQSFYKMTSDQKKVILANNEYGISMHAQIAPAIIVQRFGFGFLFGLGLDIGYNREIRKVMISFYEIHGKTSGGIAIDASIGAGAGVYFRAKSTESSTDIESKSFIAKMLGFTSASERRKGNYANIGMFVLSSVHESSPHYANIQAQATLSINPIPSALEVQSAVHAWNIGFFGPSVFFSKIGTLSPSLTTHIQNFWSLFRSGTDKLAIKVTAVQSQQLICHNVL